MLNHGVVSLFKWPGVIAITFFIRYRSNLIYCRYNIDQSLPLPRIVIYCVILAAVPGSGRVSRTVF